MNENSTLHHQNGIAKSPDNSALRIDPMQCLNLMGRHITCTQCADTCPAKALKLTATEVRLSAGQCTACGACLPVCPSGAMLLNEFEPRRFLQTVADTAEIHIHCSKSSDSETGHVVPCLQVLDARLLAAVAADGAETVVLHGTDQCSSCDRGDASAIVEQMHDDLKRWFTHDPVHLMQKHHTQTGTGAQLVEKQVLLSRRNFLCFAGVHSASEQDEATSKCLIFSSDGSSSDGSSRRPSTYQQLLAERAESLPWQVNQLPWRSRVFSDACSACLTCTQHCPTGALVAEETKLTISIWFHLSQCTDCGLCAHLCPEEAISGASVASSEELHTPPHRVMHRKLRQCAGCARSFVPGSDSAELCTACQNEHDMANDWKAMLNESS
jgi:ferredoxin